MKQNKLEEIIYEGIFCEINECRSQHINYSHLFDSEATTGGKQTSKASKAKYSKPCTCGGELRRRQMISEIESLIEELQLIAFHEGYQTRCDENDRELSQKAINATKRRSEIYKKIMDKKIKVNYKFN